MGNSASSSSSSLTPSASSSLMKHDVFLSFRGEDTRAKFVGHLEAKFKQHKIETFIDYRLHKGDTITAALFKAIGMSKISVIVFSENFASSSWCLDEVLCILNCMDKKGQVVVPIFYNIDPSYVRKQLGSYKAAFDEHKKRFEVNKVKQWKSALTRVANIAGWDSKNWRNEAELVEAVVNDIKRELNQMSQSDDFKDIVGMEESIEKMEELLCIESPTVRTVGIWGMGGLGKTTLARVVFERVSPKFEGRCFLDGVREESEMPNGLNKLKKKLYSALLEENDVDMINTFTKKRLRSKKVLIVLDDVNQVEQLQVLAGDGSDFGPGSRVIVTTRDLQVLRDRVKASYEIEPLKPQDALALFHLNAFKRNYIPTENDIYLSKKAINYADGIPLMIKILGSFLQSRRKENWGLELKRLREVPNLEVHDRVRDRLKISYNGLDREEKKVFLDIVCFFVARGRISRYYVGDNLGGNGFNKKVVIDNLIDKSLITIRDEFLLMHDLIREMGLEIAQQQILEDPPNHGLWSQENVYRVIEYNICTGAVTAKEIASNIEVGPTAREVDLIPPAHSGPQFLSMTNISFIQRLQCLPSTRIISWDGWPLNSLPTRYMASNLVALIMRNSQLTHLWTGNQDLRTLKFVDLVGSNVLTDISALSQAPNLESVNLSLCKSLCEVPLLSFQNLNNQSNHSCQLNECGGTHGHLTLWNCNKVKVLGMVQGNVVHLDLAYTSLEELPSSICSLPNLAYLDLRGSVFLKNLPSGIQSLASLKHLSLCGSLCFDNLPVLPMNITTLNLSYTGIQQVPSSSIEHLSSLKELYLNNCERLKFVCSISKLTSLVLLDLSSCQKLESFPEICQPMECLENLNLQQTGIRELPSSFVKLTGFKKLHLCNSHKLKSLPTDIHKLKSLNHLQLSNCENVTAFPEILEPMECLRHLNLSGSGIRELPLSIKNLVVLEELDMDSCKNLDILPVTIYNLNLLQSLRLSNCFKLDLNFCIASATPNEISGIFLSLEKLYLRDALIDKVPAVILQLPKLIVLDVNNCKCLKSLPKLTFSLEQVTADGCVRLTTVSISVDGLLREQWNDNHVTKCRAFSYYGCSDMDQGT